MKWCTALLAFFVALLALWALPVLAPEKAAARLYVSCLADPERTSCYEREIYDLYPTYSVAHLFSAVEALQRVDHRAIACHFLAHRIAAAVIEHDPRAWTREMVTDVASDRCSFGYVHGIAIAAFKDMHAESGMVADAELLSVCDSVPRSRARSNCYHGLGHIAYYREATIEEALSVCDRATEDVHDLRRCHAGVFMKLFFLTPDDPVPDPRSLTTVTAPAFCAALDDAYVAECLRTSWMLYEDDLRDPEAIEGFCNAMPSPSDHELCMDRVFRGLAWRASGELESFAVLCDTFDTGRRRQCYRAGAIEYVLTSGGGRGRRTAQAFCERGGDVASDCSDVINGQSR